MAFKRPIPRRLRRALAVAGWAAVLAFAAALAFAYLLPQDFTGRTKPHLAPAAATLRVLAYNVFYSNRDAAAMVASVRAVDPDVLAVEECYPPPTAGAAVGYWNRKRVVLVVGGRRVALHTVHLMPPMSLHAIGIGRREVAALLEDVASETLPVIVAGDFNFAETTPNCAALEGAGLTRCRALAGGSGRPATWPADGWRRFAPGVRIDHVFVSQELTCTASGTGAAGGSDHRPVWADVGISQ